MNKEQIEKIKEYLTDILCKTDDKVIHNTVRNIKYLLEKIEKEQTNE
jgi:hypothetical protein